MAVPVVPVMAASCARRSTHGGQDVGQRSCRWAGGEGCGRQRAAWWVAVERVEDVQVSAQLPGGSPARETVSICAVRPVPRSTAGWWSAAGTVTTWSSGTMTR